MPASPQTGGAGQGSLEADGLRDIVRDYAVEQLGDEEAVLVIDETGFLKQGNASCGVSRQYTGSAGKITNCQIEVFAAYLSRHGHAFIDRALYLPKAWTDDPARLKAAHVPEAVGFATKPIERAIAANVPFSFVAAVACTASARSSGSYGAPARAMSLGLRHPTCFNPGARNGRSAARRPTSPRPCSHPTGAHQAVAQKAHRKAARRKWQL